MKNISSISPGQRIKQARLLVGIMKQVHFAEKYNINIDTLRSWELNRIPLSKSGAEKLSKAFIDLGLNCSAEWLLYGTGPLTLIGNLSSINTNAKSQTQSIDVKKYNQMIEKEIEIFKTIIDSEVVVINDNGMEPFYSVGDYVGGIKLSPEQFKNNVEPCNCIIETTDNIILVRYVQPALTKLGFNIVCTNLKANVDILQNEVTLHYIAPVIWHRKRKLF